MSTSTMESTSAETTNRRSLRIRVVDTRSDRVKANISIPLSLVRVGLRIGARFAPELGDLDVAEVMAAINQETSGKLIDVIDEARSEHVEIYAE